MRAILESTLPVPQKAGWGTPGQKWRDQPRNRALSGLLSHAGKEHGVIGTGFDGQLQSQGMGIGGHRGSDYGVDLLAAFSVKGSDADGTTGTARA